MRRLYWYDAVILRLVLDDFFRFWVILVHPTVVSVLVSASVERCFVSRMRNFFLYIFGLVFGNGAIIGTHSGIQCLLFAELVPSIVDCLLTI